MLETKSENASVCRKDFVRTHWKMFLLFAVAAIVVLVGAILVFLWFVGNAQSTGIVPSSLGLWTMGDLVAFLLSLIFWEVLLIGIPVILAGVIFWFWWKKLPQEEKKKYRFLRTRSRATRGGNAFSVLVFIAFCIKIFLDGNWNVVISTWTFDYLVYSVLSALIWVLIIFGIPGALGAIWWIRRRRRMKP
jgi:hypothetical protein